MLSEFTYKTLNSGRLTTVLNSAGRVSVILQKKHAKAAIKLIERINKLSGQDNNNRSVLHSMILLLSYLFLLIKIMCFHGKLFQLFIFYFTNQPSYSLESGERDHHKINFFTAETKNKKS